MQATFDSRLRFPARSAETMAAAAKGRVGVTKLGMRCEVA
jgi:hypothetical protein